MNHRGRFQAQGEYIEESEAWAQKIPLFHSVAIQLLDKLKNKISTSEKEKRVIAFEKCQEFIDRASNNGGVNVKHMGQPLIKSFPKKFKERVDLEVNKGIAFIKKEAYGKN